VWREENSASIALCFIRAATGLYELFQQVFARFPVQVLVEVSTGVKEIAQHSGKVNRIILYFRD